jgi:hypothetical protein
MFVTRYDVVFPHIKKNNINTALVEINVREYGTGKKKWRIQ